MRRRRAPVPAGPMTPERASRALREAPGARDALRVVFLSGRLYFDYAAAFLVRSPDLAEGIWASGPGAGSEALRRIGVPIDLKSRIADALASGQPSWHRLDAGPLERRLASDLGRPDYSHVVWIPIRAGSRLVGAFLGDAGPLEPTMSRFDDVASAARLASAALERTLRERARARHDDALSVDVDFDFLEDAGARRVA